jgi:hypothetical protein
MARAGVVMYMSITVLYCSCFWYLLYPAATKVHSLRLVAMDVVDVVDVMDVMDFLIALGGCSR